MHERQGISPEEIVSEFSHLSLAGSTPPWPTTTTIEKRLTPRSRRTGPGTRSSERASPLAQEALKARMAMPKTIRFHLDENCTKASPWASPLGIEATTAPEAGLLGAVDEEHAAYSPVSGPSHLHSGPGFPPHPCRWRPHAGIAYCEKDTRASAKSSPMVLIWEIHEPAEMQTE